MPEKLDDCAGLRPLTPAPIDNRPGLRAIAYRTGTHSQFKATMLARLNRQPALAALSTRADTDPAIALIDAFATMADVLTFYQERIANESYLGTATERRSLLDLARLVGYAARPGLAATTLLAFTLDDAPGAPAELLIAPGARVQSVPGPGERPQVFESVEPLVARPAWNSMRARQRQPQPLALNPASVTVRGTASGVRPGDSLLVVLGAAADERAVLRVLAVRPDSAAGASRLDLTYDPPDPRPRVPSIGTVRLAEAVRVLAEPIRVLAEPIRVSAEPIRVAASRIIQRELGPPQPGVYALRLRAAIFGHNAPPPAVDGTELPDTVNLAQGGGSIDLDGRYPAIVPGSWVVLESPFAQRVYRVADNAEISLSRFGLSAKVTRLTLDSREGLGDFLIRETTVLAQSEPLERAELPIPEPVGGAVIELDGIYEGLAPGRRIMVTGRPPGSDTTLAEAAVLAGVAVLDGVTALSLTAPLARSYARGSVTISANIALATHGERVEEALGSGDAASAGQRFALRQPPLTYVSAADERGARSTLEVRVEGVRWREVPSLFGHGSHEQVYAVRGDDAGGSSVQFGDGVQGSRLPSGRENVRASYRRGLGVAGNLPAERLTQAVVRPAGVRSITNPVPATGGADPESADELRANLPLGALTLGRIVSLQDYEDFARARPGVARASATAAWVGQSRAVCVTVAGVGGAAIAAGTPLHDDLLAAMRRAGNPRVPLRLLSYRPAHFTLAATLVIAPEHASEAVRQAVEAALRAAFGFEARQIGQSVALSEVVATIQAVPGVVAVDVDRFARAEQARPLAPTIGTRAVLGARAAIGASALPAALAAALAHHSGGAWHAAELLTLDPGPIDLKVRA